MKKLSVLILILAVVLASLTGCKKKEVQLFNSINRKQYEKTFSKVEPLEEFNSEIWNNKIKVEVEETTDYEIESSFIKIFFKGADSYVTYYFTTKEGEYFWSTIGDTSAGWQMLQYDVYSDNWTTLEVVTNQEEKRFDLVKQTRMEFLTTKEEYDNCFESIKIFKEKEVEMLKSQIEAVIPEQICDDYIYSSKGEAYYFAESVDGEFYKIKIVGYENAYKDGADVVLLRYNGIYVNMD